MRAVTLYTDGGCYGASSRKSPTAIGAGIVLLCEQFREEFAIPLGTGTSQQAELLAVRAGLSLLTTRPRLAVRVITDSQYVQGILTHPEWKSKHNREIIRNIQRLIQEFGQFEMAWVKGHALSEENNRADFLAAVACGRRTCPEVKLYRPAGSG